MAEGFQSRARLGRLGALVWGIAGTLVFMVAPAVLAVDESLMLDEPPPRSIHEDDGALKRAFEEAPPSDPVLFPALRRPLEDLPAFWRDTELGVDFRTYYFRRRTVANVDLEAAAIGGTVRYRSGWLLESFQLGAALLTSQKLYGPRDRDGTGLLRRGQRGYTVLGEAFASLKAFDQRLTGYRQPLTLPYLNGNDGRMTPNTFDGVTLTGGYGPVRYSAGHLFEIKRRNEENFISFSEAAGAVGGGKKDLTFVGIKIEPVEGLELGAVNHYVEDTLNTAYTEIDWLYGDPEGWGIRLGTQFTHQRSVGSDRLTGSSFDTWVAGGRFEVGFREALLSVAVSITDDDDRIRNPWGSYPGYLGMMQRNFNDANEKAWGLTASWYFRLIGLPDLSLALRYNEGYDRIDVQTGTDLGDRREFNSTLDYRIRSGSLRGLWLRARFAWGEADNGRRDSLEARIVLRYEFQVL